MAEAQPERDAFSMRIAIASGKGGTGKTTVATNLAYVASRRGRSVAYLDCDVEEPNGHIFLKPSILLRESIPKWIPQVDQAACTSCGVCGEVCEFSAIACIAEKVLLHPELCHGCGGCHLACPEDAIIEVPHNIGVSEVGQSDDLLFAQGILNIGEPMSPPAIRAIKSLDLEAELTVIDAPPGTSCPVIQAVQGADLVLLVTEPTPFGLHDLTLAVEMTQVLDIPFGVVINRAGFDDAGVVSYCQAQEIPILQRIPDDRRLAEAYSEGVLACNISKEYEAVFASLLEAVDLFESSIP